MAAAVLGHAARRLGGGALRQTQEAAVSRLSPALELAQRRLTPRFTHTEVHQRCTCRKPAEMEADMKQIQKKKEELYDLMGDAHKKYGEDTDEAYRKNGKLFKYLSGHVERRPDDPIWRSNEASKRAAEFYETSGKVAWTGGICSVAIYAAFKTADWVTSRFPLER